MSASFAASAEKQCYKIIFTGPVGAGKTTAITSLSDEPAVTTDEQASDMTQQRKQTTTVAMDYGVMNLGGDERIHLYGTPGQERFNFMWDILVEGGIGLILLLDNTRSNPFQDLQFFLDAFNDFIENNKVIIGITFMDVQPSPSLQNYHQKLAELKCKVPVFEVDSREQEDVATLVQALLYSHDPWLGV